MSLDTITRSSAIADATIASSLGPLRPDIEDVHRIMARDREARSNKWREIGVDDAAGIRLLAYSSTVIAPSGHEIAALWASSS